MQLYLRVATRPGLVRLDELLVSRGLVASREKAKALILAGSVRLPGRATAKAGLLVREDLAVVVEEKPAFVSRGGLKLAEGLDRFGVSPADKICADFGASTGGFTDCLLQRGARRVYAIDVGYGQLDWKLRENPRVVALERTNARNLDALPESVELVTIDASFISLKLLLPAARRVGTPEVQIVALVKPQFEAGRERVPRGGVVRDPAVHRDVLTSLAEWLRTEDFSLAGVAASPLRGPAGNVEFLMHIRADGSDWCEVDAAVEAALAEAEESR